MSVPQTKNFNPKALILNRAGKTLGIFASFFVVVFGILNMDNTTMASSSDRVTVDGVTNTAQYLTAMVLHAPGTDEKVVLMYDAELNALRIKGAVNADALVIGDGQSSPGNAILGGTENKAMSGSNNGLIVGGSRNILQNNSENSIVVGGSNNSLLNTNSVAIVSADNTTFPAADGATKEHVFVVGGNGNRVQGSMIFVFGGGNNTVDSESVLLGRNIQAGAKEKIFVWSPSDETFSPQQSSAFYVNSEVGVGLNTNNPQVKFDFGNAGGLKLANVSLNTDASGRCNSAWKGVMAYVSTGGVSGICGCNGQEWVPLTSNPIVHKVCINLQKASCEGTLQNAVAQSGTVSPAFSRWNSEANSGNGGRQAVKWTYGGIDALDGGSKECGYVCNLGFHPGVNNPEGWQMGGCEACTDIVNKYRWRSAGTGDDNCDFSCKGGFKYKNLAQERSCTDCEIGTWTANDNQSPTCSTCIAPARLYIDKDGASPHYTDFTTKGVSSTTCDFLCSPRYAYFYNGKATSNGKVTLSEGTITPAGNVCVHCPIGTWSAGGQQKTCAACTNLPAEIGYTVGGVAYSLSSAVYNSNGTTSTNCGWQCRAELGFQKQGDNCVCSANQHLENGKCVNNRKLVQCDDTALPANAVIDRKNIQVLWNGTWTSGSWGKPAKCSWVCQEGYKQSGNTCIPKVGGMCGAAAGQSFKNSPTSGLCATDNTASSVSDNGTRWERNCTSIDGQSVACSALKNTSVDGQCNNITITTEGGAITAGSCLEGTPESFSVQTNGWSWSCRGSDGGGNALNCTASCGGGLAFDSETKTCKTPVQSVNGQCQPAEVVSHGYNMQAPGTCAAGNPTDFAIGTNGWNWTCKGINGGTNASCSGACKSPLKFRSNGGSGICLSSTKTVTCSGTKPTGEGYVFGSSTYTQSLHPSESSYGPDLVRSPVADNSILFSCQYSCNAGYTLQNGACAKSEKTRTINVKLINPDNTFDDFVNFEVKIISSGFQHSLVNVDGEREVNIISSSGHLLRTFSPGLGGTESWSNIPKSTIDGGYGEFLLTYNGIPPEKQCTFSFGGGNRKYILGNDTGSAQQISGNFLLPYVDYDILTLEGIINCSHSIPDGGIGKPCLGSIPYGGINNHNSTSNIGWKYSKLPGECTFICNESDGYNEWNPDLNICTKPLKVVLRTSSPEGLGNCSMQTQIRRNGEMLTPNFEHIDFNLRVDSTQNDGYIFDITDRVNRGDILRIGQITCPVLHNTSRVYVFEPSSPLEIPISTDPDLTAQNIDINRTHIPY